MRLVRRGPPSAPPDTFEFDALDDLTFTIGQGESVAFVGRNGAGKSTLLKVLSRITPPSRGWVEVRGRVGALLEVGTGFHNELTGRENVYLNGAILGLTRREIQRRFDSIVEFAEVTRFLDTPIKRYSSGMKMRLAFAVAAHLEPEILVVDEVLAVGDAAFQRKCVSRMGEVIEEGRTVLVVSHNLAMIQTLCPRGILLKQGRILVDGPIEDVVSAHLRDLEANQTTSLGDRLDRDGEGLLRVTAAEIAGRDGGPLTTGRPARFALDLTEWAPGLSCEFRIYDEVGTFVCALCSVTPSRDDRFEGRLPRFVAEVDELPLVPGRYRVDIEVYGWGERQDEVDGALTIDVEDGLFAGRPVVRSEQGVIAVAHRWTGPEP